jgi:sugar O-acyltransferase (sialic acid O-acetyltransferase NeuD family)
MEKITIVGYSGHAYVVLDACLKNNLPVQYYNDLSEKEANPFNLQYIGDESQCGFNWNTADSYILGIGDNHIRACIAIRIEQKEKKIKTVIHPSSIIANHVTIGTGSYIGPNAVINALASIGNYCIINTSAIIEHECQIADAVHIGPGAVLAGQVIIGQKTFVGANVVIKQGIHIGESVIIGAGSVVLDHIPNGEVWIGNPAKKLR